MKTLHYSIIVITSIIFLICSSSPVFGSEPDWKTLHVLGKFLGSNPPKPDQTFIFKYAVINGTMENLTGKDGSIEAKITGNDSGLFKILIPRNYPYTNSRDSYIHPDLLILENGIEVNPQDNTHVVTECYFEYSIPFSGNSMLELLFAYIPEYTAFPYHGDKVLDHCISETISSNSVNDTETVIPEFPLAIPVLLISIIALILFHRLKFRIN